MNADNVTASQYHWSQNYEASATLSCDALLTHDVITELYQTATSDCSADMNKVQTVSGLIVSLSFVPPRGH